MIADGLSQLGRSADGSMQVFLTLFLPVSWLEHYWCDNDDNSDDHYAYDNDSVDGDGN